MKPMPCIHLPEILMGTIDTDIVLPLSHLDLAAYGAMR